jgi:hypothetical protein
MSIKPPVLLPEDLDPLAGGISHESADRLREHEIYLAARRRKAEQLAGLIRDYPDVFKLPLLDLLAEPIARAVAALGTGRGADQ